MVPFYKVVWGVVILVTLYQIVDTWTYLRQATSAPQQAAIAGMGAFYVIAVYVFARALDALSRK